MRHLIITCVMTLMSLIANAQNSSEIKWGVFASGTCEAETFTVGMTKQDFIDVKQVGNKFYWGKDNVYTLYNKKVNNSGFMSFTTYTFVDKYAQRGTFIYQHNRNADWATKHMFYIFYEGEKQGMYYCSREPEDK